MTNIILDAETSEALRVSGIGTAGVTYSFLGMPLGEVAALLTAIYIFIKIVLLSPKLYEMFKRLRGKAKDD